MYKDKDGRMEVHNIPFIIWTISSRTFSTGGYAGLDCKILKFLDHEIQGNGSQLYFVLPLFKCDFGWPVKVVEDGARADENEHEHGNGHNEPDPDQGLPEVGARLAQHHLVVVVDLIAASRLNNIVSTRYRSYGFSRIKVAKLDFALSLVGFVQVSGLNFSFTSMSTA